MKVIPKTTQLYKSKSRYNILKGGAGSGKSVGAFQVEIRKASENIERTLIVRKVARTLRHSVFQLTKDILSSSEFIKGQHYEVNSTEMSFQFKNGSVFWTAGLDDVDKLKSIAGITRIVIEEADQISEDDLDQLDLRLRGENLNCPQITMMFNPVSQSHWLKKRFFDNPDPDALVIESSYLDNPFLDEGYKRRLKMLEFINPNKHRIYVLNEWGIEDTDKLFIRNFNRTKHIGNPEYNPGLDLYLAFDLNYDPTCLAIQKHDNGPKVLAEYGEKGMNLPFVLGHITKRFGNPFYIINGDASGHYSRNLTDNNTSYEIIRNILGLSWSQFNVPKANPSHKRSRLQCNALFDFTDMQIHESCVNLIKDVESAIVDDKGSLDDWKKENPVLSHWLDPLRYHANAEHQDVFQKIGFEEKV